MSPSVFCLAMLNELAVESRNDQWVRGANALCELYSSVDATRFETILVLLAADNQRTALADGARWLLARWQTAGG